MKSFREFLNESLIPDTLADPDDLLKFGSKLRSRVFVGAANYTEDSGGYNHSKGYRTSTYTFVPAKGNNGVDIRELLPKEVAEELNAILHGKPLRNRLTIGLEVSGDQKFEKGSKVTNIRAYVLVRVGGSSYLLPFSENGDIKGIITDSHLQQEILDQAVWDLKFNKDLHMSHTEKDDEPRHIGIGSQASTKLTTHTQASIDMRKYVKKYGEDRLKSLLKKCFAWNRAKWDLKNGIISFSDSFTDTYD
jgi:hypothetical protein